MSWLYIVLLGGVGIGVVSIISPLYISEVSVAQYRGRLVSLYQLAVTVGFLGAYLVNFQLLGYSESHVVSGIGLFEKIFVAEVWRGMLGMETLPALLFFTIIFFIPESPRWLILKGREERGLNVLQRIYNSAEEAMNQMNETKSVVSETKSEWALLLQPGILKAVIIGVAIAILGQFMGVNAVLYYGPSIFEKAGLSGGDSLFYQVLVGLVNTLTTVLALAIIDRVGRKKLVYYGVSGMVLSLLFIGIYFFVGREFGVVKSFLVGLLLVLCVLLCCIYLCSGICASFRNVSYQSTWFGYVYSRIFSLDWNIFNWAVDSLDAPESYPRRNILLVCCNVCALYAHCMETCTGNDWQIFGRDRTVLDTYEIN